MLKPLSNNETELDRMIAKLRQMYENWGIDTTDMEEDELQRVLRPYISGERSLEKDLKASAVHAKKFKDDII